MFRFIPFQKEHFPLFMNWLTKDHVKPFWKEPESEQELKEKFWVKRPRQGMKSFIIEHMNNPVGYVQYYEASKIGGGWWLDEQPGSFGIDVMIGEENRIGKGEGPKIIKSLVSFLRKQEPRVISVIADPSPANQRAIRAFEKAGFKNESEIKTPDGPAILMRFTAQPS